MKSESKLIHFHSRKCIWKCRLENGGLNVLKFVPKGQLDNKTTLVLVMAWHWTLLGTTRPQWLAVQCLFGAKPWLEPMMTHFTNIHGSPDLNASCDYYNCPLIRFFLINEDIYHSSMSSKFIYIKTHLNRKYGSTRIICCSNELRNSSGSAEKLQIHHDIVWLQFCWIFSHLILWMIS